MHVKVHYPREDPCRTYISTASIFSRLVLWGCHVACEVNVRRPRRGDTAALSHGLSLHAVWLSGSPCCLIRTSRKSPGAVRSWVTGQGGRGPSGSSRKPRIRPGILTATNKTSRQSSTADQRREVRCFCTLNVRFGVFFSGWGGGDDTLQWGCPTEMCAFLRRNVQTKSSSPARCAQRQACIWHRNGAIREPIT